MKRQFFPILILVLAAVFSLGGAASQDQSPRFEVQTETVRVPVVVFGKREGKLYTDLTKENFKVLENGQPQTISSFASGESPLTLVLLLEYSKVNQYIRGEVIRPAGVFVSQIMGPKDYAAIIAYDIKPEILTDFTQNRQELLDAVNRLVRSPAGFRESNLYDALKFTLTGGTVEEVQYKGLSGVEGRTGVLLIATGIDTFSSLNHDEIRRVVGNAGVPIYSIGIGELAFIRAEPYLDGLESLRFRQAQNTLRTFSNISGGRFYSPRFQGAVHSVLDSIAKMLRYQYTLGYKPSAQKVGKNEIKVLVDLDGDGKSDNDRLEVQHRQYYVLSRKSQ